MTNETDMTTELPPPPVPADCDLRDFPFMPVDINRLFASAFHAKANDSEWRAGVTSWLKSFHQVPAGSLPDDDIELCRLVELGRDTRTWRKVKAMALHGWYPCSDGRLYHDVIAEKVIEAWRRKGEQKARTLKARVAAMEKRLKDAASDDDRNHITALLTNLRLSLSQALERSVTDLQKQSVTETNRQGQGYRQGQGQGDSKKELKQPSVAEAAAAAADEPDSARPSKSGPGAAMASYAETDEAHRLWMPVAYELRIPEPGFLNGERRSALAARLAECGGIEGWKLALDRLREAKFLRDDVDPSKPKHWVNLMTICKPETFTGLMEGRYAERHDGAKPTGKVSTVGRNIIGAAVFAGHDPQGSNRSRWDAEPERVGGAEVSDPDGTTRGR